MSSNAIEKVRDLIDSRLEYYRTVHECIDISDSADTIEDELYASFGYCYPYSAFVLLSGLRWCLSHHVNQCGDPTNEFYAAITVIDIPCSEPTSAPDWIRQLSGKQSEKLWNQIRSRNEESRRFKSARVVRWPKQDSLAVYEWLKLASSWQVMDGENRESINAMLDFWKQACSSA